MMEGEIFMKYSFTPKGVCPSKLEFEIDNNNIVKNVQFSGGCNGNLKAIATLVDGMPVDAVADKLTGIQCGLKQTSCSDQLATALREAVRKNQNT